MKDKFLLSGYLSPVTIALALMSLSCLTAFAQRSKEAVPTIAGAAVPLYPPLARVANVQGVVRVKITTDGHRVVAAHAEDGPRVLAIAAEDNARTWQFAVHEPTTFTAIYRYEIDPKLKGDLMNPELLLRLPTEVEVRAQPWPAMRDPSPSHAVR